MNITAFQAGNGLKGCLILQDATFLCRHGRFGVFQTLLALALNKPHPGQREPRRNEHQVFWGDIGRHINVENLLIKVHAGLFRRAAENDVVHEHPAVFHAGFDAMAAIRSGAVGSSPTRSIKLLE